MNKNVFVAAAAVVMLAGCTDAPDPAPDPVALERVLTQIEQQEDERSSRFQAKIAGADRVSATLAKVEPQKLNPEMASVFLR